MGEQKGLTGLNGFKVEMRYPREVEKPADQEDKCQGQQCKQQLVSSLIPYLPVCGINQSKNLTKIMTCLAGRMLRQWYVSIIRFKG